MTGTEITKKASQFHNNYNALSINILPLSKVSLSQSRYAGSWARIPGPTSLRTGDEIRTQPFSLKVLRKTNCFKWYKLIGQQIHLSTYQTHTMNRTCQIEGGRWKMKVEDKWHKNCIFHLYIYLVINDIHPQRWKMEDRKSFSVGEVYFKETIFLPRIFKVSYVSRKSVKSSPRIQNNQATCLYKLFQWLVLYISWLY